MGSGGENPCSHTGTNMILVAGAPPDFFSRSPVDRPIRSDSFDLPSAVCSTEPRQKSRIGKECQPKIFGLREKRKGKDEKKREEKRNKGKSGSNLAGEGGALEFSTCSLAPSLGRSLMVSSRPECDYWATSASERGAPRSIVSHYWNETKSSQRTR